MTKQSAELPLLHTDIPGTAVEEEREAFLAPGMTAQARKPKVVIRKYEKEDHEQVCKLFYNGIVENWLPAYSMSINMKSPIPTVIQLVQLAILYQYLASFLNFLLAQFFIQALIMFGYFTLYWSYAW